MHRFPTHTHTQALSGSKAHLLLASHSRMELVPILFVDVQQTDSKSFGEPELCYVPW